MARKELPYSFDVRPQPQQANIGASPKSRRTKKKPPLVQPRHPGGIKRQTHAGQRTSGHVSSIGEPEQQSPSDVQRLASAIPVSHPSCMPKPPLVQDVQPRNGSSGGEDRDSLEGGQASVITVRSENSSLGINVPRTPCASNNGAQRTSHGGIRNGHSYDMPNILGQQKPPPFALPHRPSFQSLRIPANTEKIQTRAKVAERQAQINVFEIRDLRANVEAESPEKLAPLQSIMDHFDSQILVIQKEMADHWNAFSAERQKAEAAVIAKVTDLEAQIHALKQGGSYAASVPALSETRMERKL